MNRLLIMERWRRMFTGRAVRLIALLIASVLLAGSCSGSEGRPVLPAATGPVQTGIDVVGITTDGMTLPVDEYTDPAVIAARRGSVFQATALSGVGYSTCSAGTLVVEDNLMLMPDSTGPAWAVYRFPDNLAADTPLMFHLQLAPSLPDQLYLGFADYSAGAWRWLELDEPREDNYFGVPAGVQPISPGGSINVIVLAMAGSITAISEVGLYRNVVAPPPAGLATNADDPWPDRIMLSWDDPAVTYPGLSYDAVRIERSTSTGSWVVLTDVPAGDTEYNDTWSASNSIPYGMDVDYRLRTIAGETTGMPGIPATGLRLLQDVANLAASDGEFPDLIRLTWDPVPGAESYELAFRSYPDYITVAVITDGSTTHDHHWQDIPEHEIPYGDEIDYFVRASWKNQTTAWSDYEDGYRRLPAVENIAASDGDYSDRIVITWNPLADADGYVIWISHSLPSTFGEPDVVDVVEGGSTSTYAHSESSPCYIPCLYNHEFLYTVVGYYVEPEYNQPDEENQWDLGYRVLNPPADFQATTDTYSDRIRLTWSAVGEATGYRIFRDGSNPGDLIAEVGLITEYADTTVTDQEFHDYWIQSVDAEHLSELSPSTRGSRNLFASHRVFSGGAKWISLAVTGDKPILSCNGGTPEDYGVTISQATSAAPTSEADWQTYTLGDIDPALCQCPVAVINSLPAVAYYNDDDGSITYARATTAEPLEPGAWQSCTVRSDEETTYELALTEIAGRPAIGLTDLHTTCYCYPDLVQPSGPEDWNLIYFHEGWGPGIAMMEQDGLPVLLAQYPVEYMTTPLAYPTSQDDWSSYLFGQEDWDAGDIALNGNQPITCYSEGWLGRLEFAYSTVSNPQGQGDWIEHEVYYADGSRVQDCQTGVIDGKPVICFSEATYIYTNEGSDISGSVQFVRATTATPSRPADWEFRTIASWEGDSGTGAIAMAIYNGKPLIGYSDTATDEVRFAIYQE